MMANQTLNRRLPITISYLPDSLPPCQPEELLKVLESQPQLCEQYPFLFELAQVELLLDRLHIHPPLLPENVQTLLIAPGVELLEVSWTGFPELLSGKSVTPEEKKSLLLIIPQATDAPPLVTTADNRSLLALKIVSEEVNVVDLAEELDVSIAHLQNILKLGVSRKIILKPASKIARPGNFCADTSTLEPFSGASIFTLQWHITQTCDLQCRHCYDRTQREEVSFEQGKIILDQLYQFCDQYNVEGQVSFTGGNPLLHPHFFKLYQEARDRGFRTAILGNPTTRKNLERIVNIQVPEFYQISLEGLSEHNDYIRGNDHFHRSMKFLEILKELDIYSMVMLTLTKANQNQVLPLGEKLRYIVDSFTFNRLSMVGEGASLISADLKEYGNFLRAYQTAAKNNDTMRLKDNLFNILKVQKGIKVTGGCTGYGCGAAFNFVSLLPDGQVHACRKFPSLIGNVNHHDLTAIYKNSPAAKYRQGSNACFSCKIRPVCGGCLAVTHGFDKDPLVDMDPYCFLQEESFSD